MADKYVKLKLEEDLHTRFKTQCSSLSATMQGRLERFVEIDVNSEQGRDILLELERSSDIENIPPPMENEVGKLAILFLQKLARGEKPTNGEAMLLAKLIDRSPEALMRIKKNGCINPDSTHQDCESK